MFKTEAGHGRFNVSAEVFSTDEGIIVHLLGGEQTHIGAVVISVPRKSLTGDGSNSCTTSLLPLIGHKDDVAAKPLAEAVAKLAEQQVVVVSGIHIDNATAEELKILEQNIKQVTQEVLAGLQQKD